MVSVSLIPRKGNSAKVFPHTGHLGLSPVLVAGTIKLDMEEEEDLDVSQILIRLRCCEAVGGQAELSKPFDETRLPENLNILWETALNIWPPPGPGNPCKYRTLKRGYQSDWRLIVPRSATDHNHRGFAIGSMTYKSWRSWWQLEAVVRGPPGGRTITKTYPLHLQNYRNLSSLGTLTHIHGSTKSPLINYTMSCPTQISCGDQLTVSLSLKTDCSRVNDLDPLKFKKVIISLERTLVTDTESGDTADLGRRITPSTPRPSLFTTSSSDAPPSAVRKLKPSPSLGGLHLKANSLPGFRPSGKSVVSVVAAAEMEIASSKQDKTAGPRPGFAWSGRVDLTVPRPKSAYHYSIGDTCKTKFVSVTYHITAKVVIKTKSKHIETVSLGACEVELSCVPTLDRESACRHYKRLDLPFGKCHGPSASLNSDDGQALGLHMLKAIKPTAMTL
ncbi:hypothetical protein MJO28_001419 [Puccinia striiformis f. sp. tritici]|uniref:Arrestin C-terminal-like domain-containing protein n=2 Tax=Puccinia striiformis TaxID=27350 RepID=A0A2S4W3I3_9BASI|nr:hypothetical protein Pst134EB_004382 [Puccinia striiformis f. sp. tritici]KAI7960930.1 hypothetical protein MJO28_001419 [Puccinia striiformis f. sp. tritici]KAI7965705.1 hypothetical protein MJO29_001453 [Puccinia striiformis f. sp. tritici]POW16296.1 hypothetical protein PSTT_01439 [Puccinia striiformis]